MTNCQSWMAQYIYQVIINKPKNSVTNGRELQSLWSTIVTTKTVQIPKI